MAKPITIYLETSSLLEGVSGIARWVEEIKSVLSQSKYNVVEINKRTFGLGDNIIYDLLYYNILLPFYLKFGARDTTLLLIPNNVSKFFFRPAKNTVYFLHDLIPLDERVGYKGIRRFIFLFKLKQVKRAKAIITTTQIVKKQIVEVTKTKSLLYPVYGFIGKEFSLDNGIWQREDLLPSKYILAVGSGEHRKNLDSILDLYALDRLAEELPPLVLFGNSWRGFGHKIIHEKVASLGISHRVCLLGSVTDKELCYLYTNCEAFIYPSIAEGFGLPPIEALACGARVIVNDLDVFREVLGESAVFVDASKPNQFFRAVLKAIEGPKLSTAEVCMKYSQDAASHRISDFLTILERSLDNEI